MPFHLSQLSPPSSQPSLGNDPLSSMVLMRKLRHRKGPESHTGSTWEPGLEVITAHQKVHREETSSGCGERSGQRRSRDEWQALLLPAASRLLAGPSPVPRAVPSPLVQDSLLVPFFSYSRRQTCPLQEILPLLFWEN